MTATNQPAAEDIAAALSATADLIRHKLAESGDTSVWLHDRLIFDAVHGPQEAYAKGYKEICEAESVPAGVAWLTGLHATYVATTAVLLHDHDLLNRKVAPATLTELAEQMLQAGSGLAP